MRISSSDYIQNQGSHPAFGPKPPQLANNPFVRPQAGPSPVHVGPSLLGIEEAYAVASDNLLPVRESYGGYFAVHHLTPCQ